MSDACTTTVSTYAVLSELLSTVYNLTALSKTSSNKNDELLTEPDKIKRWLTIIEYCETFLELAAISLPNIRKRGVNSRGENRLKWIVVTLVQLAKSAGRMTLLLKYKEGLLPNPPIVIQKEHMNQLRTSLQSPETNSFVLNSGRKVRSVRQAYVQQNNDIEITDNEVSKKINNIEIIAAEIAYIVKPLAHLTALYIAGRKSWKPWILSLAIDIGSLILLSRPLINNDLSTKQKQLILQRRMCLLTYLLRSPFYDKNTKVMLQILLTSLEMYVPCTSKILVQPLLAYLPLFQQVYFYVWSR